MGRRRNYEALGQLRRVVNAAPEHRFNMRFRATSCGTAFCAAGWAAQDPWFKQHGFELVDNSFRYRGFIDARAYGRDDFNALERCFGLTKKQASLLFGGELAQFENKHVVSKQEVLDNIDLLLARKQPVKYKCLCQPN